jgi:two-component system sensor histidine kinase MprB
MLRTRFTVAVAVAVATVTLAITAVAFVVVRTDLEDQLRDELGTQATNVYREALHFGGHIPPGWVPPHSERFGAASPYMQLVTDNGEVWAPPGDAGLLAATPAAEQVASGTREEYYANATVGGVRALVLTTPLAQFHSGPQALGLALQLAVPLNGVDADLASVGTTLALLSAAGVALAALVGWGVARAGLAPVGRLATVAERVTATGDPSGYVAGGSGERVARGFAERVDRPDELGRLAVSFDTMLGALQRSLAAQRRLVSDASHELRTPLTSMRVNVELLADNPDLPAAERQLVLDRVVAQGAELSQLVAGITELARGDPPDKVAGEPPAPPSGSAVGAREDVPLHEVVAADLAVVRRDWPATEFPATLEPCVALGDADRLRSAIRNLLDNAAKFGPPGAPVEVRLSGGELTVRDHGPGIAPDDLPHVFDRFYRAPSARGVPGSGLGLSIVRQVAESHGGTILAEAAPGGGTLMRLRLPTPEPAYPNRRRRPHPSGAPPASPAT